MTLTAAIFNDTRADQHFGCFQVMRNIEMLLERRGVSVTLRSRVRHDWEHDRRFLAKLGNVDLIVINGEGTLHHSSKHGERLLRLAAHPARRNKPVFLLNALYQENSTDWDSYLQDIQLISVRDSRSYAELERLGHDALFQTLDFSLFDGQGDFAPKDDGPIVLGDSVHREMTDALAEIARGRPDLIFLPTIRGLKATKPAQPLPLRIIRQTYIRLRREAFRMRMRNAHFCRNEVEYLDRLTSARFHVTGRFHGICFSILAGTPFYALTSNSWKNETLLSDLGLDKTRIKSIDDIRECVGQGALEPFSETECAGLQRAISTSTAAIDAVMDRVVDISKTWTR